MSLALVASSGGHLFELLCVRDVWDDREVFWVTFATPDALSMLEGERVYWAHHPTTRNLPNLVRNAALAWTVLRREKPQAILSTGAGVAVPFLMVGRLLGIRTVYIESLTRIGDLSLSGRLLYPFTHRFLVQWEELGHRYRRAEYHGRIL